MLNRRVDILFDKDLWKKSLSFTKSRKISAGELIRRAVREYLAGQKEVRFKLFKPRG